MVCNEEEKEPVVATGLFTPPSQFQDDALVPVPPDLPHTPAQLAVREEP
jgi:hypothetical protein